MTGAGLILGLLIIGGLVILVMTHALKDARKQGYKDAGRDINTKREKDEHEIVENAGKIRGTPGDIDDSYL